MKWNLDKDKPICPQLRQLLSFLIASGVYTPHQQLPSVRQLAVEAGVNPNTVQKTFEQLNSKGIIYARRGAGWFVSEDINAAQLAVKEIIKEKTAEYFDEMHKMGLNDDEIRTYVKEWDNECTTEMQESD